MDSELNPQKLTCSNYLEAIQRELCNPGTKFRVGKWNVLSRKWLFRDPGHGTNVGIRAAYSGHNIIKGYVGQAPEYNETVPKRSNWNKRVVY